MTTLLLLDENHGGRAMGIINLDSAFLSVEKNDEPVLRVRSICGQEYKIWPATKGDKAQAISHCIDTMADSAYNRSGAVIHVKEMRKVMA